MKRKATEAEKLETKQKRVAVTAMKLRAAAHLLQKSDVDLTVAALEYARAVENLRRQN